MSYNRIKDVFKLYKGNLVAQILNLLVFFGAAYILPIESIGSYFIFVALTEIIGSFSTLQSHLTIALPLNEKIKFRNWRYGTIIVILSNGIFFVGMLVMLVLNEIIGLTLLNFNQWYFIIPFSSLLYGLNLLGEHYYIASHNYSFISRIKILKVVIFATVALFNMYVLKIMGTLIIAYVAGHIVMLISYYLIAYKKLLVSFFNRREISRIINYYYQYKNILVFNTIASPINMISNQLPYIFLPILFDKGVTANYGMVFKTLLFPLMLFSQVYGQDFYIKASEIFNGKKSLMKFYKKESGRLLKIAIIPFLIVFIIGPWFFKTIMGEEWIEAGYFARVILIWLLVNFIKTPLSSLISILNIQKKWLIFEVVQLIVRLCVLGYSYVMFIKVTETLFLYASISALAGVILMIILYRAINKYENMIHEA